MKMSIHGRSGQRLRLSGVAFCLLSASALSEAGIGGSDRLLARAPELDVLGLVGATDTASGTLTVSGQTVRVTAGTKLTSESIGALSALPASGALVAVYGALNSDGTVAASQVTVLAQSYVAGATTLYVRGVVTSVNPALAKAQVGGLSVDYSASLYNTEAANIKSGSVVEFSGIQTSVGSALYASTAGIGGSDKAQLMGIGGSDKVVAMGIGGSDKVQTLGIGGSDKVVAMGIGGSDKVQTLGIGGSDRVVAMGIGGSDR